jgi:chorismate-pyruvate lyase
MAGSVSSRARTSPGRKVPSAVGPDRILFPLDFLYRRSGVASPDVHAIAPDDIPFPYRTLLVHTNDMTLTLERHFGGPLAVRALSTLTSGDWYLRRVLLAQEYSGRPVEMGAIRINLGALPESIRGQIRKNQIPLGRLLRDGHVDFESRPRAFLAVTPNPEMMGVFWMREPRTLYGRRTEVYLSDAKIGDIVEILPVV